MATFKTRQVRNGYMPSYREGDGELRLDVQALPGASRTQIRGEKNNRLRVSIAAAPEDGKANKELISFLAKKLDCPKSAIHISAGEKARLKTLSLPLDCKSRLQALLEETSKKQ